MKRSRRQPAERPPQPPAPPAAPEPPKAQPLPDVPGIGPERPANATRQPGRDERRNRAV